MVSLGGVAKFFSDSDAELRGWAGGMAVLDKDYTAHKVAVVSAHCPKLGTFEEAG